ncbi:gliding motility-associated C-terminal domain-containing protein [uncultured Spirosoma sp.]|uniref:gliding motility-associated C-terminal domain-containing protein n=1 Tax=uncultured Spirosoma sp. TaxID=278208 RepID=UPI002588A25A|nr:gliding motility-associated C-terminal domain-containing protein [uncultured Spirosoma sp.]
MQILGTWLTEKGAKIERIGLFAALLIATTTILATAQNVCINPVAQGGFTLEKTRICLGTPVKITGTSANVSNVGYNYEYNGNGFPTTTLNQTTYSYTKPGSYTIIQVGSGGGLSTGTIACQQVDVLPVGIVRATARSCGNRVVTMSATLDDSNNKYDAYQINWGDGVVQSYTLAQLQARPQHTYTDTRNRTATIQGVYNAPASCGSTAFSMSVTPLATATATTPPVITQLKTVDADNITLTYQASSANTTVQLLQRDGSGTYVPTSQTGTSAGTFSVQTNTKQTQCFQLASQDECGTTGPISEQVCSLALTVTASSKKNNLSWEPYQGTTAFRSYRIYRNGSPLTLFTNKASTTTSDESDIQCGVQYCYTIEATLNNAAISPTIVTSAPTCVTGVNAEAPDSFTNVLVSIEDDKPRLIAALPTASATTSYTMIVSRSNGGAFQQIGALTGNSFVDEAADPNAGSYCYQVAYQNTCGQVSAPSPTVCTVWLSSKAAGGIDWTRDSPFSTGEVDNYTVEVINPDNGTKQEIPAGTSIRYEPDPNDPVTSVQRYRIIAVSAQGVVSYSNFYKLVRQTPLFVPDAFSPNGDQANDVFLVKGATSDQFRLTVYSRWGQAVFSSTSISQGWDGTINGQPAIEGQYMYRIEVEDPDGNKTVRTGAVLLLR